jgi:hypothetical protein
MGQSICYRPSRAHCQGFQAKTPRSQQLGVDRFEEFLHRTEYRLPIGATSLPSPQRRGTRHPDLQRTLCGRTLLSLPCLSIALVLKTLTASVNHFESPADLKAASSALRR